MDGILHPSIVSRGSITAAIDCVWTLMDEEARLLNGTAPYEIIRLSVHISAVTRLSREDEGGEVYQSAAEDLLPPSGERAVRSTALDQVCLPVYYISL